MSAAEPTPDRLRAIDDAFERALDLETDARLAYLAELRAADEELAGEVESLLEMAADPDGRLTARHVLGGLRAEGLDGEHPALAEAAPGDRLGPYRVVSELGRGGMAVVYLAERADGAFEQSVALKLLAGGMPSAEAGRRFEQERQILASLDHPAIARLLDGGFDARGRPYLVMEHVDGEPIDRYCDRRGLGVGERLQLIVEVARAVEHAHARLVVHRDLKPSNLLVTADGRVKLLDFGIAKLLDPRAAGRFAAPATRTHMRLLTPEYASPEQASGEPVTTASDVYQLGLLLFELLTGRRPFAFRGGSAAEVERVLGTAPPPVPSTCEITAEVARARAATPAQLKRSLRGDLDAILLKALRKEPALRYASTAELIGDLEAHCAGRPVGAVRGTRTYRLRKFAGRNRWALAAGTAFVVLVLGYAATVNVQSARVTRQRDRAEAEAAKAREVTRLLVGLFEVADPDIARGREISVAELLDRGGERLATELAEQPEVRAELLGTVGEIYRKLGRYDRAESLLREALALPGGGELERGARLAALGRLLRVQDRAVEAEAALSEALAIRERLLGAEALEVAELLRELGAVMRVQGRFDEAAARTEQALSIQRRRLGERHAEVATTLGGLGAIRRAAGDYAAAASLHAEALAIRREVLPPDHPDLAASLQNLALARREQGDYAAAEPLFREAVALYRRTLGDDHPYLATALNNLALTLRGSGQEIEEVALLREAVDIRRRALGPSHPIVARTMNDLALALQESGRREEAGLLFAEGLRILPPEHENWPVLELNLGLLEQERGNLAAAERLMRSALSAVELGVGSEHATVAAYRQRLGALLSRRGRFGEAETQLRRALATLEKHLPMDHPRRALALRDLGTALLGGGRPRDAEAFLIEAAALLRDRYGADHPEAVEASRVLERCRSALAS